MKIQIITKKPKPIMAWVNSGEAVGRANFGRDKEFTIGDRLLGKLELPSPGAKIKIPIKAAKNPRISRFITFFGITGL